MPLPQHFLDQLLARTSLVHLIGRHVRLEKKGQSFFGLCPFHREKTPSFSVNEEKGLYYCFGCGESGNAISFMKNYHHLSSREAIESLSDSCGMTVPSFSNDKTEISSNHLYRLMELAAVWFEHSLYENSAPAKRALNYLHRDRGLNDQTIKTFRIGWSPNHPQALLNDLIDQGYSIDDLITLGLANDNKTSPSSFFRSRLIIPITDHKNRVCAFGGRVLPENSTSTGKYINSKNHPLFSKSQAIFNLYNAKKHMKEESHLVLVEGYMDVITLHQNGFRSAVATLGTAANTYHLQTLWSISSEPIVCFDSDKGGYNASIRLMTMALAHISSTNNLKFTRMPKGEDPDSLLSTGNSDLFNSLLTNSQPLSRWLWSYISGKFPHQSPEDLAKIEQEGLSLIESINDKTMKKHLRNMIKDSLWQLRISKQAPAIPSASSDQALSQSRSLEQRKPLIVLIALIKHPTLLPEFATLLSQVKFESNILKQLTQCLLDSIWLHEFDSYDSLKKHLIEQNLESALQLLEGKLPLGKIAPQILKNDPQAVRELLAGIEKDFQELLKKQELQQEVLENLDKLDPKDKTRLDKIKEKITGKYE